MYWDSVDVVEGKMPCAIAVIKKWLPSYKVVSCEQVE